MGVRNSFLNPWKTKIKWYFDAKKSNIVYGGQKEIILDNKIVSLFLFLLYLPQHHNIGIKTELSMLTKVKQYKSPKAYISRV